MSTAFYYKVSFAETNPNAAICKHYDLQGVDRNIERKVQLMPNWPQGVTFFYENGEREDLLGNALGWLLISKRIKATLTEIAATPMQFLPVTVVDTTTGHQTLDYCVLNVLCALPALHRQHALYRISTTDPDRLNVIKVVLNKGIVNAHPIFRLKEFISQLYISEDVKNRLDALVVSGFRFIPTKVLP